jgi:putative two-component system response regulator
MRRPYKEAWPLEQVIATVRGSSGSHFEPALVQDFDAVLPRMCGLKFDWDTKENEGHAL